MAEIRYAGLWKSPEAIRVTTIGTQPGPPGGDGWAMLASLPVDALPAGSGQYAVIVSGRIGDVLLTGGQPITGVMQVCLGTVGGTRHPRFRVSVPLAIPLGWRDGIPFQFMLLISSTIADTLFGSSIDPATTQLAVWGRVSTNGEPQTYYAEFTVADLSWLWFDLARIPSGHWQADEVDSDVVLGTNPPTNHTRIASAAAGGDGETWLHFANVWYEPRIHLAQAPYFRFGVTPDGTNDAFLTRVGNVDIATAPAGLPAKVGRFGLNQFPAQSVLQEVPQCSHGGFWVHENTTATTKPAYYGHGPTTIVHRYRWLGIRIDTLPDVRWRYEAGPLPAGVRITDDWSSQYVTVERPAAGILTDPIVMVHQTGRFLGAQSYGTWVTEAGNGKTLAFGDRDCFPRADQQRGEAVSAWTIGRRQFQVASPAMQWRTHLVGSPGSTAALKETCDLTLVQFHPVRDPENLTDPPGSLPPPIIVVPGKQAADAASLPAPPALPNANPQERGLESRGSIRGATGYRRTWPLGAKVLRMFSVTWGPLDLTLARQVFDFLRANPAWRYTPPRGAAIAVLSTSPPELAPADHRNATVSVEVVVLAFTGA